jgi:hypothetical protein
MSVKSTAVLQMSDALRPSVVHRKAASEAVLDIHDDQTHDDKAQRQASAFSRKGSFLSLGLIFLLVVMGANYANSKVQMERPLRIEPATSPSVRAESAQTESRGHLDARIDGVHPQSPPRGMPRESSVSVSQNSKMLEMAPNPQQRDKASDSIDIISEPGHVDIKQLPTAAASNVHSHLLAFIDHLNSAGRNPRSDCDDSDFKDADLVHSFHNKKADICTSTSAPQQPGAPKISNSHFICYQHQQARHSATDSVCEGRNVALHLPSFEGTAMTGFVEATWMSMKQGALQAACTPTGAFSKDKFPLCLGDWFVNGFRQVMVLPLRAKPFVGVILKSIRFPMQPVMSGSKIVFISSLGTTTSTHTTAGKHLIRCPQHANARAIPSSTSSARLAFRARSTTCIITLLRSEDWVFAYLVWAILKVLNPKP